mgnify:CR=1 FL=1
MEFPAFRVVKRHGENRGVYSLWECICKSCGNPCVIQQNRLHIYKSCGCRLGLAQRDLYNRREFYALNGTLVNTLLENRKVNKNSTTGHRGVSRMADGKYRAYITLRHRQIHLGVYNTLDMAIQARKEGEELYFAPLIQEWTELHGRPPSPRGKYVRKTSDPPEYIEKITGTKIFLRIVDDGKTHRVGPYRTIGKAKTDYEKITAAISVGAPLQVFTGENWDAQKAIATTRQTLGLTQEEFARRISINDSGVSRWETGETLPSRRVREKLYAAFGSEIFTEFSKLEGD